MITRIVSHVSVPVTQTRCSSPLSCKHAGSPAVEGGYRLTNSSFFADTLTLGTPRYRRADVTSRVEAQHPIETLAAGPPSSPFRQEGGEDI